MRPLAIVRQGVPQPLRGAFVDEAGVRHGAGILKLWSDEQLRTIGVYPIVDDDLPPGQVVVSWSLLFDAPANVVRRAFVTEDMPPPPPPGPAPVPKVVSRFQAQAALLAAGTLGMVRAAVAQASAFDKLAWEEAAEFRRSSPTLNNLAAAMGMTQQELDDLFRAAVQIEA